MLRALGPTEDPTSFSAHLAWHTAVRCQIGRLYCLSDSHPPRGKRILLPITPSRSRKTARSFPIPAFADLRAKSIQRTSDRPRNRRTGVPCFLPLDMGQPGVTRHHVEDHFASFKFETEIQLTQSRAPHGLTQSGFILLAVQH